MRKISNFVIAVILGTAAATAAVHVMDNMISIPYGKDYLAYAMLAVAMTVGIGFATVLNNKMNNHKRGE